MFIETNESPIKIINVTLKNREIFPFPFFVSCIIIDLSKRLDINSTKAEPKTNTNPMCSLFQ